MIIIHPLRIAYQPTPKVGSSSIVYWLYTLLGEIGYSFTKEDIYQRKWLDLIENGIVEKQSLANFKCPDGYFVFGVVRDPVERMLSIYNNRVLHHNKINASDEETKISINNAGLSTHPTLEYFIDNFKGYRSTVSDIRKHSRSQRHILGADIAIYTKVFKLEEMNILRQTLIEHWQNNNLAIAQKNIPEIPRLQNKFGKKKYTLADLEYRSLQKCFQTYRMDYHNFPMLVKKKTEIKWKNARLAAKNNNVDAINTSNIVTIKTKKVRVVRLANIFETKPKVNNGIIKFLSGTVLLKPSINKYKIVVHDARSISPIQWELPSPNLFAKYPKNPAALNARFNVQDLQIAPDHPVEIFLENDSGRRHLLFVVTINK